MLSEQWLLLKYVCMHHYILTAYLNVLLRTAVSIESPRSIDILMLLMEIAWLTLEVLHLNLYHTYYKELRHALAVYEIILTSLQGDNYYYKFYIMILQ